MLTSQDLAQKLKEQMERKGTKPPELAALCEVRVPSVYDWINYGRIAKKHLPRLAEFFGTPLGYWLGTDAADPSDDEELLNPLERQLLALYRSMSESAKARLLQDANHLHNDENGNAPSASNPFAGKLPPTRKSAAKKK